MFVNYKTPLWYLNAMEGILDKMCKGSDKWDFDADLKKMYCLADEIQYITKNLRNAQNHRNKIKKQYGDRLNHFYASKNSSSNFNFIEFCATQDDCFFSELFEAKKLLKELKEYILSARLTIKCNLGTMHDVWKKWDRKLAYTEKRAEKAISAQNTKGKYRLNLTREESLKLLRSLTDALKKDPTKDKFVLTLDEL